MEEGSVTVEGVSYPQLKPFAVCAARTTFAGDTSDYALLPDLLDHFLLRLELDYPAFAVEVALLLADNSDVDILTGVTPIAAVEELIEVQRLVRLIGVGRQVVESIVRLAVETRQGGKGREFLSRGVSLRAK